MNILLVNRGKLPALKYGGTERVIWYLGLELSKMGHNISYLVSKGSQCNFARVIELNPEKSFRSQIPPDIDIVHFNFDPEEDTGIPYIITNHGNRNDLEEFNLNTVFVSSNHAERYGSASYVYNGLDWDDYGPVSLDNKQEYFHFLGKAAWQVKNLKGAIDVIKSTNSERLEVMGGHRLNLNMGFRFTLSTRVKFHGMVGGTTKSNLLRHSKGLIFPVLWYEPFGLALVESLYFGSPVFGTPYGSLPEIVKNDFGFLSNEHNELAEAIENVKSFSRKRCHEYAMEEFNSLKMAHEYLKKYEFVLNGGVLNKHKPRLKQVQKEKFLEWK